jgi:hypothetical protein
MIYKAIKLKTGELIACSSEKDITTRSLNENRFITVHNPVMFNSFKFVDEDGELVETISMMPLIPVSEDTEYDISTDCIMSVASIRAHAVDRYTAFLDHMMEQRAAGTEDDDLVPLEDLLEEGLEEEGTNIIDMSKFSTKIVH